jgi:hypothetical protein
MQLTSPNELWQMMEISAEDVSMTAQTRHDLEHAIKLLFQGSFLIMTRCVQV